MDTDKRLKEIRQRVADHNSLIESFMEATGLFPCEMEGEIFKFGVDAREDIPFLLDEIERLRAALEVFGNELNYVSTGIFGEYGPGPHCYPWVFADEKLKGGE